MMEETTEKPVQNFEDWPTYLEKVRIERLQAIIKNQIRMKKTIGYGELAILVGLTKRAYILNDLLTAMLQVDFDNGAPLSTSIVVQKHAHKRGLPCVPNEIYWNQVHKLGLTRTFLDIDFWISQMRALQIPVVEGAPSRNRTRTAAEKPATVSP